jgi:hypothetical protein
LISELFSTEETPKPTTKLQADDPARRQRILRAEDDDYRRYSSDVEQAMLIHSHQEQTKREGTDTTFSHDGLTVVDRLSTDSIQPITSLIAVEKSAAEVDPDQQPKVEEMPRAIEMKSSLAGGFSQVMQSPSAQLPQS